MDMTSVHHHCWWRSWYFVRKLNWLCCGRLTTTYVKLVSGGGKVQGSEEFLFTFLSKGCSSLLWPLPAAGQLLRERPVFLPNNLMPRAISNAFILLVSLCVFIFLHLGCSSRNVSSWYSFWLKVPFTTTSSSLMALSLKCNSETFF